MISKPAKPPASKVKSGRLPYVHDSRTLDLADYLQHENLATVPEAYNWEKKINPGRWGALGNLKINNCTCAAAGFDIIVSSSSLLLKCN